MLRWMTVGLLGLAACSGVPSDAAAPKGSPGTTSIGVPIEVGDAGPKTSSDTAAANELPIPAGAAAKILRIDPRAGVEGGEPILTTVIELVGHKRLSDITSKCALLTGNANLDCVANELDRPGALYVPSGFPEESALFTVAVDGIDRLATLVSVSSWGASKKQDRVGTAWLLAIDAAATMGGSLDEAKHVAKKLIDAMGPHDIVDVIFFNDRAVVKDSKWLAGKAAAATFVDSVPRTYPRQGRSRQLGAIIKQAASDGFHELGNPGGGIEVPLHQAMVVLSSGLSGSDVGSPAQSALALSHYLTLGRFPDATATLPKMPVPIVSVWFPRPAMEEIFQHSRQFMESLANPQSGGYFSIVREGQHERAANIVNAVRRRFDQMYVVRWRVPCVAATAEQTFKLVFRNDPPIIGDTFIDAPIGLEPALWPRDINVCRR